MTKDKTNININSSNISDEQKEEFKKTGKLHIEKEEDGKKVKIDIDKSSKSVNVSKTVDGKKTNIKVGLTGVKVNDEDGKSIVNVTFIPIFIFAFCVIGGFLFFIYKVVELIISLFK